MGREKGAGEEAGRSTIEAGEEAGAVRRRLKTGRATRHAISPSFPFPRYLIERTRITRFIFEEYSQNIP